MNPTRTTPRLARAWAGVALAALVAWTAPAAAQLDAFSDDLDVNIVNVDVVVTDRDGQPMTGLGFHDFELHIDGTPVEIRNFLELRSSVGAPGAADVSPNADAIPESTGAESKRARRAIRT